MGGMRKQIQLLQLLLLFLFNATAQEKNSLKLKVESGLLWDAVNGRAYLSGSFFNLEPKLKASQNTVIGFRIGGAFNTQLILASNVRQFHVNNDIGLNSALSIGPSFDYYFVGKALRPYVGVGVSNNFLRSSKKATALGKTSELKLNMDNQIGFLLRGGIDINKFVLGLEFNYIPKADVKVDEGQKVGTIAFSNVALSIGHIIGSTKNTQ